jgi:hypothetical protein
MVVVEEMVGIFRPIPPKSNGCAVVCGILAWQEKTLTIVLHSTKCLPARAGFLKSNCFWALLRTRLSDRKFHRFSSIAVAFQACKIGGGRCVWATSNTKLLITIQATRSLWLLGRRYAAPVLSTL